MPIRLRGGESDMQSSDDESGNFTGEKRTDAAHSMHVETSKRSCASLLPQSSACAPSDYAPGLLALPGSHDNSVNQIRLHKCMALGISPHLVQWLGVEFGAELLSHTLV
jgi:GMP synthase-like glutamine amidotransferase